MTACYVRFARSQASLMGNFANNLRPIVSRTASIQGGALRAPPCIEEKVMGDFAMGRELFAK